MPSSILPLNWNLAPIPLYAALCPFTGEGFLCFILSGVLGFVFWVFYTFVVASIFISHLREKTLSVLLWMCCFLSATGAPLEIVGCQGWNSLTKISCQVTVSERIRYLSWAAIHKVWNLSVCSQVQAGSLSQLREPHTSRQPWLWALQECSPPDRGVWQFCQCQSLSHKISLSLVSSFREKPSMRLEHAVWEDDCVGEACICLLRLGFYKSP